MIKHVVVVCEQINFQFITESPLDANDIILKLRSINAEYHVHFIDNRDKFFSKYNLPIMNKLDNVLDKIENR